VEKGAHIVVPPDDSLRRMTVREVVLLGRWLAKRSPDDAAARVTEATSVLSKIVNIRFGGQHSADRRKTVAAFQEFGLDYPPNDSQGTWATLRQFTVNALEAIRQEVPANFTRQPPGQG
jgi:hypothetical protein